MSEEIDLLWSLRDLDEQRAVIQSTLSRFPEERSGIAQRVAGEHTHLEALKARLADLQKRRREREREIESTSEQERKFQSQLPSVRKNEEYTALLHEIAAVKSKRSDVETEVLMLLDQEESGERERPALEQALQAVKTEAAERNAAIDREEKEARDAIAGLDAARAEKLGRLPPQTRSRYERIHSSRDGRAVVAIAKGACGGCYRAQPPQVLQEARRRDRLLTCEGCGRLLVWPPETA